MRYFLLVITLNVLAFSENVQSLSDKIKLAEAEYDLKKIVAVQTEFENWLNENESNKSGDAYYWLGRAYLVQCNIERFFRRELKDTKGKEITRAKTAKVAWKGISYINKTLEQNIAHSDVFRVRGELTIHTVTGIWSGMYYGPKALEDINKALELDSKNARAHISVSKMYYYKPKRAGGDVDKSIEASEKAYVLGAKEMAANLLGRCYLKKKDIEKAKLYFEEVITLNPVNKEASHFLQKIAESE